MKILKRRGVALKTVLLFGLAWAACLMVFAFDSTLPGEYAGDTNRLFVPFRAYLMRMFRSGNFPDLAAGLFFGQPSLTFGQISLLYPTTLLGIALPLSHQSFFLADLWIHLVVASAGCTLLLRGRGHSMTTSLALAWVYANSLAVLLRSWGHWTLLHQAALIPFALYAWERLPLTRRRSGIALGLAGVLGLMILAHNPQWLYLLFLLLLPLELGRIWLTRKVMALPRRLGLYSFVGVGALLLGASVLVPMAAGFGDSHRTLLAGPDLARRWDLAPRNLLTLFFPGVLFGKTPAEFFGRWSAIESLAIAGRGTVVLAAGGVAAAFARPRTLLRKNALPVWLTLGGLFLGTAPSMPWFGLLVEYLPMYSSFRSWGRASIFVVLGLVMLAAAGLDALTLRKSRAVSLTVLASPLLLLSCSGLLAFQMENSPASTLRIFLDVSRLSSTSVRKLAEQLPASLLRDFAWYAAWTVPAALAVGTAWRRRLPILRVSAATLLVAELLLFQRFIFRQRAPVLEPATAPHITAWLLHERDKTAPAPYTTALLAPELANFALHLDGVRNLAGADSNMRAPWAAWLNQVQGYDPASYQLDTHIGFWRQKLVEGAAVRSFVKRTSAPENPGATQVGPYSVSMFSVRYPYAETLPVSSGTGPAPGTVKVLEWEDGRVRLETSASLPMSVRVREFPDRRWLATLNGRSHPVKAEIPYLTLTVPAGVHELRLEYVDKAARASTAVSAIAWIVLGLLWTAAAAARHSSSTILRRLRLLFS